MLHAIRIKDGKVNYCSRLLRTNKLKVEMESGRSKYIKIGEMYGYGGLVKILLEKL